MPKSSSKAHYWLSKSSPYCINAAPHTYAQAYENKYTYTHTHVCSHLNTEEQWIGFKKDFIENILVTCN